MTSMIQLHTAVGAILALLVHIQTGDAIKCYECNSYNNTKCAMEKPPPELEKDCVTKDTEKIKHTMCRKIVQTIEFEVNGLQPDSRVIRTCAWDESNYKGRCYQRSGFGGRQEVCSCTTDLCNAAGAPSSALAVLTGALGLLLASHAL